MDFYTRQIEARRQTRWLLVAFIVAVALVVLALDVLLFTLLGVPGEPREGFAPFAYAQRNPGAAFFCTLVVLGVIGLSSLFKTIQLREGGGIVARSLGGVLVPRDTTDLKRKRLHNVVEEMAIASGVPMPELYVLEHESGINAFAAGHTPANAAIAVTQGALDTLSRDELQGVIAHEFGHVLNGDMRLNVQLIGWLFGLFVVALIGRTMLRYAPRGRRSGGWLLVAALGVMVLGYLGLFFGRLLQAAVSRQRERLADASSVQFTRNPEGLKGALVKIAGVAQGSRIVEADPEQAAHMLFAPGLSRLFATHPPLAERIHALDPHFDVKQLPRAAAQALATVPAFDPAELEQARVARVAAGPAWQPDEASAPGAELPREVAIRTAKSGGAMADALLVPTGPNPAANAVAAKPQQIASQVGALDTLQIAQAKALRLALPPDLREFVEAGGQARAIVLALLVSRDPSVAERQLAMLRKTLPAADFGAVRDAMPLAAELAPMLRLPALLQAFPALRRLPLTQRQSLARLTENLIRADARIDVFEFCLARLLGTLLRDEIEARAPHGNLSLADAADDLQVLFAVLASCGANDAHAARMAYEAGMQCVLPMHRPPYQAPEDWPRRLSQALLRLEKLHPYAKKAVIEGLVKTIAHDELLSVAEAELLRTVCATLHCPLPPLLPDVVA
ncbi:MAG TPA: M48 family metallopeptidase [Steroidobacteraceae bacterium]|nr:M48 family metallopeptidase [Steroidobacteraceae bacterium]